MASTINFCPQCDNMLYMKIKNDEDVNKLVNYCKNCGYQHDIKSSNTLSDESEELLKKALDSFLDNFKKNS